MVKETKINLLLDHNIIINLDAHHQVPDKYKLFNQKCNEHALKLWTHEIIEKDINRHRNRDSRAINKSKFDKYSKLEGIKVPGIQELEKLYGKINNENDEVDVSLLYILDKTNSVHFLITEDQGIHSRANFYNLQDKVFYIHEAIQWIEDVFEEKKVFFTDVIESTCNTLDIECDFFDSLKKDYGEAEFQDWLKRRSLEHRPCWKIEDSGKLIALLIYKEESKSSEPGLPDEIQGQKILKLCCFKVHNDYRGKKLGEQLLKKALWHCRENNYNSVYVTTFESQQILIERFRYFGFEECSDRTKINELILWKTFKIDQSSIDLGKLDPLKFDRKFYPFYFDAENVNKYMIPIQPQYHSILFPELEKQLSLSLHEEKKIPGNTIRKIYLSHSLISRLQPGDIIFFYRSKDFKAITSVGIVENVIRANNISDLIMNIGKRSVYSISELQEMLYKPVLIINFLLCNHLKETMPLKLLKQNGMSAPQSITKINENIYMKIKQEMIM